jgi:hypothetical protein
LDLKGKNLWKNHVEKLSLEMVELLLELESEEGYKRVTNLIETTLKNYGTKLNTIFRLFQHKCMTG